MRDKDKLAGVAIRLGMYIRSRKRLVAAAAIAASGAAAAYYVYDRYGF